MEKNEDFEHLKKKVSKILEFDCRNYSNTFLVRRIDSRLRANSLKTYKEYADFLDKNPEEHKKLDKELTIHVTDFFRDQAMWDVFIKSVIPKLIEEKGSNKRIRVWSAGCSSGEEPYSIAMCFHEVLKDKVSEYNIKIVGTDYDSETIKKAKAGVYPESKLKDLDDSFVRKYFEKKGNNYHVLPDIKSIVDLQKGDIFSPIKPRNNDIIFCRNTVIYFEKDAKTNLYLDFYENLNKGGFFIMGKTEILLGESRNIFKVFDGAERIFVKI